MSSAPECEDDRCAPTCLGCVVRGLHSGPCACWTGTLPSDDTGVCVQVLTSDDMGVCAGVHQ